MLKKLKSLSRRVCLVTMALFSFLSFSIISTLGAGICSYKSPFKFRSGIIFNLEQADVYLMNPRGGIHVVDLASGRLSWTTTRAAKPIILAGNLLIAQTDGSDHGNKLQLVGLDTLDGGQTIFETDIELPPEIRVSVDDGLSTSFRTDAWIHGEFVVLSWTFSERYAGGPQRKNISSSIRTFKGSVQIDPKTGKFILLTPEETPPPARPRVPDSITRQATSDAISGPLWITGNVVATTKQIHGRCENGVMLVRWNFATGEALPDLKLFGTDYTLRYPSVDQKHLLASKLDYATLPPWHWLIFSIDSGDLVAEINMESPGARFFIWRNYLIYTSSPQRRLVAEEWVDEPLRLRAIDLENGNEFWSWQIRDTAYRGPYPPHRSRSKDAARPTAPN